MIRYEALALAIAKMNNWDDPDSRAFKLRNPGMLTTFRPEKKFEAETGDRIFSSMMGGFKALTADIHAKCSGKNPKLTAEAPLKNLLTLYKFKVDGDVQRIVRYLRKALLDESITGSTPISWFVQIAVEEN
jgi:hypothetical protein